MKDHHCVVSDRLIVPCTNASATNHDIVVELMKRHKPDGVIASVEELITPFYLGCKQLHIAIPDGVKVLSFSNVEAAPITQPAFHREKRLPSSCSKHLKKSTIPGKRRTSSFHPNS